MTYNKTDLVNMLCDKYRYDKKITHEMSDRLFDLILETIEDGDSVSIYGFGVFDLVKRKEKLVRHITTKEIIEVPEHYSPKFTPGRRMDEAVKAYEGKRNKLIKMLNGHRLDSLDDVTMLVDKLLKSGIKVK